MNTISKTLDWSTKRSTYLLCSLTISERLSWIEDPLYVRHIESSIQQILVYPFIILCPLSKGKCLLTIGCRTYECLTINYIYLLKSPNNVVSEVHHSLLLVSRSSLNLLVKDSLQIFNDGLLDFLIVLQLENSKLTVRYSLWRSYDIAFLVLLTKIKCFPVSSCTRRVNLSKSLLEVFLILIESLISNKNLKEVCLCKVVIPSKLTNSTLHIKIGLSNTLNALKCLKQPVCLISFYKPVCKTIQMFGDFLLHKLLKLGILFCSKSEQSISSILCRCRRCIELGCSIWKCSRLCGMQFPIEELPKCSGLLFFSQILIEIVKEIESETTSLTIICIKIGNIPFVTLLEISHLNSLDTTEFLPEYADISSKDCICITATNLWSAYVCIPHKLHKLIGWLVGEHRESIVCKHISTSTLCRHTEVFSKYRHYISEVIHTSHIILLVEIQLNLVLECFFPFFWSHPHKGCKPRSSPNVGMLGVTYIIYLGLKYGSIPFLLSKAFK